MISTFNCIYWHYLCQTSTVQGAELY